MGTVNSKFRIAAVLLFGLVAALAGGGTNMIAQSASSGGSRAAVQYLFPEQVTVEAGKPSPVALHFRIAPGLHINSNTPREEYLIPTEFSIPDSSGVKLKDAGYPAGTDITLPIDPKTKLSVYTGEFVIRVRIVAPAGNHLVEGKLHYQACNESQCLPPKTIPVAFDVIGK